MVLLKYNFKNSISIIYNIFQGLSSPKNNSKETSHNFAVNMVKKEPIKLKIEKQEENDSESSIKKLKWEPPFWKDQLDFIKQMRSLQNAPVDAMGCDSLASLDPNISPKVICYFLI